MITNKSNDKLIVALDVADIESAKKLVNQIGDEVSFYKIGLELMMTGGYFDLISWLKDKNKKVFADLKLHDISQTVEKSVKNLAKYQIDLLTIHAANSETMLRVAEVKKEIKVVAVTILTNNDQKDLAEMGYSEKLSLQELVIKKAENAVKCNLDGIVCSALEAGEIRKKLGDNFLIVSPGIRYQKVADDDQKRVADVKTAIANKVSYLVVGRPITASENPQISAAQFNQLIKNYQ